MKHKNKILGIVGRQGSGKSTLTRCLVKYHRDCVYLDIDSIVHELYKRTDVVSELCLHFGTKIYKENFNIDTKALGKIVFNDTYEYSWLNNYIYPKIREEALNFIKQQKNKLIVIDWALLMMSDLSDKCDLIWYLKVPYEVRKKRVMERDNITEEYFDLRESRALDLDSCIYNCDVLEFNSVEEIEDLKYSIENGATVRI